MSDQKSLELVSVDEQNLGRDQEANVDDKSAKQGPDQYEHKGIFQVRNSL